MAGEGSWPIPPLFTRLVDDTSLLRPKAAGPAVDAVVSRYLAARDGHLGEVVGQLVCPISRLPMLVKALARVALTQPIDLSLVVDTGLGAVPKALSTVFSRPSLLIPRAIETAAPPDVDAVWLERVSEFVPEDVVAVVEPRRPTDDDPKSTHAWLDAVHRVADHGCAPKLRCGGSRASDVPPASDVEDFLRVAVAAGRGFTVLEPRAVVHAVMQAGTGPMGPQHGIVNLLVAVARVLAGGDVRAALRSTDGAGLAAEVKLLSDQTVGEVRGLLQRCGADPEPVPVEQLAELGLLA